ncbi:beta-glucosidase [Actinomadura physcomitrii]|nr:glycoside hydrolase family 3 C-terminal domain-containing protein [Actinomadura physcomitrii]
MPWRLPTAVMATLLLGTSMAPPVSAQPPSGESWRKTWLSPDNRAAALVAVMTLDEKIQLVHGVAVCAIQLKPTAAGTLKGAGFIPGIPRLGVPDINYTDGPAGVTNCGGRANGQSTMLPAPIERASTWNPELEAQTGRLMGTEARVQGFTGILGGVSDLIREPRWGRSFEAYSEDPILNAELVTSNVKAIQDQKVVATLKHFALNNQETNRSTYSVQVDERSLRELHLLPYELAVPASGAQNVMCSYNKVNGVYACENDYLINQFLKKELGYTGQVQSDWGATHSTVGSALAGLDEEEFTSTYFDQSLKTAVTNGQVPLSRLNDMVKRKLRGLIAVGVLDDPPGRPGSIDVARGQAVAKEVADQGLVLLKNNARTLPLKTSIGSVAVIGSHADAAVLSGGGSSQVSPTGGPAVPPTCNPEGPGGSSCPIWAPSSPLNAIKKLAPRASVRFADGTDTAAATRLAAASDVAIVFANEWRAEGRDRDTLALPTLGAPEWPTTIDQEALISAVGKANKRTIVVLENGGPVTMPWLGDVSGVIEAWYPGIQGGQAIADVLFGRTNPSGKLPVTFPRSLADTPMGAGPVDPNPTIPYSEGLDVGYRWYDAKNITPLFPFGYGLSFTDYRYSHLRAQPQGRDLRVTATITNTGHAAGAETAQIYLTLPASAGEPPKRLIGFQKVSLEPGRSKKISVTVPRQRLAIWDTTAHRWKVPSGRYTVSIAASSRDIRGTDAFTIR